MKTTGEEAVQEAVYSKLKKIYAKLLALQHLALSKVFPHAVSFPVPSATLCIS